MQPARRKRPGLAQPPQTAAYAVSEVGRPAGCELPCRQLIAVDGGIPRAYGVFWERLDAGCHQQILSGEDDQSGIKVALIWSFHDMQNWRHFLSRTWRSPASQTSRGPTRAITIRAGNGIRVLRNHALIEAWALCCLALKAADPLVPDRAVPKWPGCHGWAGAGQARRGPHGSFRGAD